ncbi:phosphoethanolamine transferase [Castellaniella caeni]|uniref:phosphoethanolamine transferase n=1 Tax=Castellaniella caeni TaxID=266123 RepID=UPI000831F9BA|nr:phosphoethanolamine transferase [Castellaniella caeni]
MAHFSNSRAPYWALGLLFGLLMLPNGALLWLGWPHFPMTGRIALPLSVLLTLGWFALFGSRLWLGCLLLAPAALLMPLQLFYAVNYAAPASVTVLGTLAASSTAESQQYMGRALGPMIAACGLCLLVALAAAWLAWRHRLRWQGRTRRRVLAAACLALLAVLAADFAKGSPEAGAPENRLTQTADAALRRIGQQLTAGYPSGTPLLLAQFGRYQYTARAAIDALADYRFGARLSTPTPGRQVYVLVVGESSQRGHWQLFGYPRATNPELSTEPNLVPISRMVSAFTQTMTALPVMLTRKPATAPGTALWPEASLVRAMREAGFETWWISNQYPTGPYDSTVAVYASEAEHVRWLNYSALNQGGNVDGALLAPLRQAIAGAHGNLFIVLHMLGSHEAYDARYPADFAHFKPVESQRDTQVPDWQRTLNSYDNTIRYTDFVLARIIDTLKASHAISALWFASDHGETLPSPTCDERGHGHQNRPEYQIPALFWYSGAYGQAFPERVATLRAHADQRTASASVFPSILDMAGVRIPDAPTAAQRSLFSPEWRFQTRWVNQFWLTDYDRTPVGPGCFAFEKPL